MARIIPRVCHNVNRVCYIAGPPVVYQVLDITQTYLNVQVIDLLKQADYVINKVRNYVLKHFLLLKVFMVGFRF
jgi:GMP synthase (glutamine-hydrolysing)